VSSSGSSRRTPTSRHRSPGVARPVVAIGSGDPTEKEKQMAFLVALGAFVATIIVAVVLFVTGHEVLGSVGLLFSVPCALATWIKWGDRKYR
jgi:hypothetical protein